MRAQATCTTIQYSRLAGVSARVKPQVAGRVITWPIPAQPVQPAVTVQKQARSLTRKEWLQFAAGFSVFLILYTLANSITGC